MNSLNIGKGFRAFVLLVFTAVPLSLLSLESNSESVAEPGVRGVFLIDLDDIEVSASRIPLLERESARLVTVITASEIEGSAVSGVNDLLEQVSAVDVRQRGGMGVQSDISLRGGTFDQVTLLLNGVNISSPQTGHLSADFPVSTSDIERIEVLEGPAARVFGTSAFTGAINVITKSGGSGGSINMYGGQHDLFGTEGRYSFDSGRLRSFISAGYGSSGGATPNSDYSQAKAFYNGSLKSEGFDLEWQVGYSGKDFGANTFYGAASTNQWESTERVMAAVKAREYGKLHLSPSVYWNRWYDHYQWQRGSPVGENFHRVDVFGLNMNSWFEWKLGKSSVGVESRNEGVLSSKLGRALDNRDYVEVRGQDSIYYRFADNRTNISAFLEHNMIFGRWVVSVGALANLNTALDSKFRLYPGIDCGYNLNSRWKLTASWNMALRMPTFTDLYYSGTNIQGDSNLKPEKRSEFTTGARFRDRGLELRGSVFVSANSDMIDWVVFQDETTDTYRSYNFQMSNRGAEVMLGVYLNELYNNGYLSKISVSYSYIDQDKSYTRPVRSSKYSLEYLRHKVVVTAQGNIGRYVSGSLSWRWQERTGIDNEAYGVVNARLAYNKRMFTLYAEADNLLNKRYYDYSYIEQPGIWLKAGVRVGF